MDPFLEKRSSERHRDKSSVTVAYFNTETYHPARSLNYSKDGVYIELDFSLKPGTDVFIRRDRTPQPDMDCALREGYRSVSVANVKWCKEIKDFNRACYGVGAKYYNPW
ncbi:MAG TPA: hypothetical protein HPQ03_13080 [Deltaproteobacteria bacterium]|nr:hypothetical protein [Deltaproteobacteria bacterium]